MAAQPPNPKDTGNSIRDDMEVFKKSTFGAT
jgi:hypothetical protein